MNNINRRDFLKLLAKIPEIAAAATVASVVVDKADNELEVIESGMFEHAGIRYQPIYEQHSNGAEVPLHPQASGVFIETNFSHTVISGDGTENGWREEKYTQYDVDPETIVDYFSQKSPGDKRLYEEIRERKIPFAYGDVAPSAKNSKDTDIRIVSDNKDRQEFYNGILMAVGSAFAPKLLDKLINSKAPILTRREFMKKMAVFSLAASLYGSWVATGTAKYRNITAAEAGDDYANQYEPINRLLIRLHGLGSDIHPENPGEFMRNIFMALKIKKFGEYLKSNGLAKPVLVFNVGAAHSGIEDFICLPDDVLRYLIGNLAQDYVNRVELDYGNFVSTTRIIQADQNSHFQELELLRDFELQNLLDEDMQDGVG